MPDVVLTPRESDFMRHALGSSSGRASDLGYRNYFVTSNGGPDVETWEGLRIRGLAGVKTQNGELTGGGRAYWVTSDGLDALAAYGLKVTKKLRDACP